MKKLHSILPKILFVTCAVIVYACGQPAAKDSIEGRWRMSSDPGFDIIAIFRADSSADLMINGKLFSTAKYSYANDKVNIMEAPCGLGYDASYKINWTGKDSLNFSVIQDSCTDRRTSMDGRGMKRIQ